MLYGFRKDDPPTIKNLHMEVDIPKWPVNLSRETGVTHLDQAHADLTLIAFYFLLRIGKYTVTN